MANNSEKKGMLIDVQPLKTKQEVNELIEALGMTKEFSLRNQLLFKLGISTGLRCGDLVALKVEQLKGKSSFKIREGKTKKERTVYLNNLMADLADYIETLPSDTVYLFPSRKGDGHITTTQAYRIIAKAGDMIGNYSIGTHTMRKTFGYTYYQATKDVATLMEIFNHSSQKTTLRYIGITEEAIENSIKSVSFFQVYNIPVSKLIRNIFFAFAEFERDMIVERTQEGKAISKIEEAMALLETMSFSQVEKEMHHRNVKISMSTLKRESKKRKEKLKELNSSSISEK